MVDRIRQYSHPRQCKPLRCPTLINSNGEQYSEPQQDDSLLCQTVMLNNAANKNNTTLTSVKSQTVMVDSITNHNIYHVLAEPQIGMVDDIASQP